MCLFWKTKEAGSSFYQVAGLACAREMGQNEAYNLRVCNCLHRSRGKSTSSCWLQLDVNVPSPTWGINILHVPLQVDWLDTHSSPQLLGNT